MASFTLYIATPQAEIGAPCVHSARTELCGGSLAGAVSTATNLLLFTNGDSWAWTTGPDRVFRGV